MTRLDPSFLIASERSGSNLIRSILNAHPEIYAPQPIHLGAFWERLGEFGDLQDDARWRNLLAAIIEFHDGWKGRLDPALEFSVEGMLAAIPARDFVSIYEHFYARGLAASGKQHLFIKENHTAQRAGLLLPHYPAAKFVHLVRDPRDFLASCKKMPGYKYGSAVAALRTWCEDQEAALALADRLPSEQLHACRYEALIDAPERELGELCDFMGLRFAPQMLEFHTSEDARRSAVYAAWRNVAKPIMRGNSGRYADTLSQLEIALVEERAGALMERLGYARTHAPRGILGRAGLSFYAGLEPQLRRADQPTGSTEVHRTIDRHVGLTPGAG